jgi:hypothetical protein
LEASCVLERLANIIVRDVDHGARNADDFVRSVKFIQPLKSSLLQGEAIRGPIDIDQQHL